MEDEALSSLTSKLKKKVRGRMLKPEEKMNRPQHVCLARLDMTTCEQIEIIAIHLNEIGIDNCFIGFPANSFSMSSVDFGHHSDSSICHSAVELELEYKGHNSDMLVLQSPYPEHYPNWLMDLSSKINFAYAGYALPLIDWEYGHFQTPIIKEAKFLLAASKQELKGYKKNARRDAEVHLVGNSIMFEVRRRIKSRKPNQLHNKTTLWAPHWSHSWLESNSGFSRFELALPSILQFFSQHKDQNLIFRPHPILREILFTTTPDLASREGLSTKERMNFSQSVLTLQKLLSLRNVILSENNLISDILDADQLITDGVSIISYWATTSKPMCIVMDDLTPQLNKAGKSLVRRIHKVKNAEGLIKFLTDPNFAHFSTIRKSLRLHPTPKSPPIKEFITRIGHKYS